MYVMLTSSRTGVSNTGTVTVEPCSITDISSKRVGFAGDPPHVISSTLAYEAEAGAVIQPLSTEFQVFLEVEASVFQSFPATVDPEAFFKSKCMQVFQPLAAPPDGI